MFKTADNFNPNRLHRQKITQQGRTTSSQLEQEQKYHKIMVQVYKVNEESEKNIEKMEKVKSRLSQVQVDLEDTHFIADRYLDYKHASLTDVQYKKYLLEKQRSKSMTQLDKEQLPPINKKIGKQDPPRYLYFKGAKGSQVQFVKIDMQTVREKQQRYIKSRQQQSRKIPKQWIF